MSGLNTNLLTQVNPTNFPGGYAGATAVTQFDYPQAGGAAPQQLAVAGAYLDAMAPVAMTAVSNTVTPDLSQGKIYTYTLPANTTFAVPTNLIAGQTWTFVLKQDGTGSRTATWNAAYKFAGGTKTLSTAANAIDVVACRYDGTNVLATLSTAYA